MHLIPGVDDGAMDMEMALVMMIRATEQGILISFSIYWKIDLKLGEPRSPGSSFMAFCNTLSNGAFSGITAGSKSVKYRYGQLQR